MTTKAESDARVAKHAKSLIRRGVEPSDALIHASGAEARRNSFCEKIARCAGPVLDRPPSTGERDRMIIEIGRQAERETNPSGLDFATKIRRCANLPDNGYEEMAKALRATETTLKARQAEVTARRRRQATETPRISARAPAVPVQPVAPETRGRPQAPAPAAARPMIGPSRQEHFDGRHLDHYWQFRDRVAGDIRAKRVRPDAEALIDHATAEYGLDAGGAAESCERFMGCISRDLERRAGLTC
jgi:hypothetical protein